jgi:hypothetical protein
MRSRHIFPVLVALLFSARALAADAPDCSNEAYDHRQYEVFIDAPTGYAFIKTPCGWHFVRQIEADKVAAAIRIARRTPLTPTHLDPVVGLSGPKPID